MRRSYAARQKILRQIQRVAAQWNGFEVVLLLALLTMSSAILVQTKGLGDHSTTRPISDGVYVIAHAR
ncbi:hypothetical protein A5686_23785 [Mycobacterium sp. E2479]|nr:hypothetical protein A5686_23785 [Mycobacterium sp. E2479]